MRQAMHMFKEVMGLGDVPSTLYQPTSKFECKVEWDSQGRIILQAQTLLARKADTTLRPNDVRETYRVETPSVVHSTGNARFRWQVLTSNTQK